MTMSGYAEQTKVDRRADIPRVSYEPPTVTLLGTAQEALATTCSFGIDPVTGNCFT